MDRANGPFDATAELASVERCSEPETRPPKAQPRHHAACQRGAMFMAEDRGSPSDTTKHAVLNTAPPAPGGYPAGRWRGGGTKPQPSGCEHGSTLASSVVAPESADERPRSPGRIGASDVDFRQNSERQFRSGAPLGSVLSALRLSERLLLGDTINAILDICCVLRPALTSAPVQVDGTRPIAAHFQPRCGSNCIIGICVAVEGLLTASPHREKIRPTPNSLFRLFYFY